ANVGAGFDSLGLAVSLHNVFTFEEAEGIQISSVDGTHVPAGSNNLVYRSARVVYDPLGVPLRGLAVNARNSTTMARAQSSSAATVTGRCTTSCATRSAGCVSPSATIFPWPGAWAPVRPASWRASWAPTPCWAAG